MATAKSTTRKPRARSAAPKDAEAVQVVSVEAEQPSVDVPVAAAANSKQSYKVKEQLDPHMYVTVRNGFNGKLVYRSARTGERFVWDEFGSEQEMELQELRSARNAHRGFFENNWFMIDDEDVIAYLGVGRYYDNALSVDDFDSVFSMPVGEMTEKISKLSSGQRTTMIFRAKELIANGEIDSIKTINALESCLGVELIER